MAHTRIAFSLTCLLNFFDGLIAQCLLWEEESMCYSFTIHNLSTKNGPSMQPYKKALLGEFFYYILVA